MNPTHPAFTNGPAYPDRNATTPVGPEPPKQRARIWSTGSNNPSSGHTYDTECQRALALARSQATVPTGADADEFLRLRDRQPRLRSTLLAAKPATRM